ncbi:MAG: translation initiation factor IF-1, partial [Deinococcota bacterium]
MAARRSKGGGRRAPRQESDRPEETNQDTIRTEGVVLEARPNTTFLVQLDAGPEILAHVGGKMRRHYIR